MNKVIGCIYIEDNSSNRSPSIHDNSHRETENNYNYTQLKKNLNDSLTLGLLVILYVAVKLLPVFIYLLLYILI